jgi:drug/metabolite transporter (DMT)-like permease
VKSDRLKIALGFALASLIWGSTWLVIKIGLESVPPLYGVAMRFNFAMAVLFVVLRVRKIPLPFDRASVQVYAAVALLSFSIPFALVYWGEQYIPSGLASVLFAIYPFVVAIGSHLFLKAERLNAFKVAGILLGFSGVTVIFWADLSLPGASVLGMGAVLLSTVLQGSALVIVKRSAKHLSPAALSFGGMLFGVPVMYLLALAFEDFGAVHFDLKGIGSIVYLGTFGTVVTFLTYYWLLQRVEAVYLSFISLVTPVLAVLLGALVLGEALPPSVYSGTLLVLVGIFVANGNDLRLSLAKRQVQREELDHRSKESP